MSENKTKVFLHADLDAFFASVEQLDNPQYRGKPVIICGDPKSKRSVVSTCSYEARRFGVHSAMSAIKAYQLCPNGIFVPCRMERYCELSTIVMNIFRDFSPDVHQISIDEAFIDLTGTERLWGTALEACKKIKQAVLQKTGLTISVGIATNKYVAKIASDINKPDGITLVENGKEEEFMLSLPIQKIWGAGEKTLAKLKSSGLFTTKQIHASSLNLLESIFGKSAGAFLYNAVRGIDDETFSTTPKSHSISAERTFCVDLDGKYIIETEILRLCTEVQYRMHQENYFSKSAFIKIRLSDFSTNSLQVTREENFRTTDELYETVISLFNKKWRGEPIRLLGVGVLNCTHSNSTQMSLFESDIKKKQLVENAVISYNAKNKKNIITKARLLNDKNAP